MDKLEANQKDKAGCPLFNRPFGLYIHWPFCRAKCPYCDFNSHVRNTVDEKAFGNALLTEMTHMASLLPEHPSLSSLFFGGGTPSLMPPSLVEQIIIHAKNLFGLVWGNNYNIYRSSKNTRRFTTSRCFRTRNFRSECYKVTHYQ